MPVKIISPWIKLLVLWRPSGYDWVKVQEFSVIQVVRMLFMVVYFSRNSNWKLSLFVAVFIFPDSRLPIMPVTTKMTKISVTNMTDSAADITKTTNSDVAVTKTTKTAATKTSCTNLPLPCTHPPPPSIHSPSIIASCCCSFSSSNWFRILVPIPMSFFVAQFLLSR